jgi:hypothetical protein
LHVLLYVYPYMCRYRRSYDLTNVLYDVSLNLSLYVYMCPSCWRVLCRCMVKAHRKNKSTQATC